MDFLAFEAKEICEELEYSGLSVDDQIDFIKQKVLRFDPEDRIELLYKIRNKFQQGYDEHLKECKATVREECDTNKRFIRCLYFIDKNINSQQKNMFDQFHNDTIRIIKKDGTALPFEIKL